MTREVHTPCSEGHTKQPASQEVMRPLGIARRTAGLILAAIVVLQLAFCAVFAVQKEGLFQDESYTFFLSNTDWLNSLPEDGVMYEGAGEPYRTFGSVQDFMGLDASMVCDNLAQDNHPPLYFLLFSFAYSLFPGSVALAIGVMLNALFMTAATPLIFLICRRLGLSGAPSLAITATWAFSVGMLDNVLFLRMYALLAFFFVMVSHAVLRVIQEGGPWAFVEVFTACFLGFLSQYFFVIFAFGLCLAAGILLLFRREIKRALLFAAASIGGIVAGVIAWPAAVQRIFWGDRGPEAIQAAVSGDSFLQKLLRDWQWVNDEVFGGLLPRLIVVAVVLAIVAFRLCKRRPTSSPAAEKEDARSRVFGGFGACIAILFAASVFYIVMIARVAPYASNRYLFAGYPAIYVSVMVTVVSLVAYVAQLRSVRLGAVALGIGAVCVLCAFCFTGVRFLTQVEEPIVALGEKNDTQVTLWRDSYQDQSHFPNLLDYENNLYFRDFETFSDYDFSKLGDFTLFVQKSCSGYPFEQVIESIDGAEVEYVGDAGELYDAYSVHVP